MLKTARLRIWLQLLRAPNLFTVPGDPLAGYLLANSGFLDSSLAFAVVASLCFYAAGLLMNDLVDVEEDGRDRPSRPLPSGAASSRNVRIALWALNVVGLAALAATGSRPAFIAGVVLVVLVWSYNHFTKRLPIVGAVNMGLCRGVSVMLGGFVGPMASFGYPLAVMPALIFALYIAAVTNLARHETRPRVPILARLLPFSVMLLACAAGARHAANAPDTMPAVAIFGLFFAAVTWLLIRLFPRPRPALPPLIGQHIRALLLIQAAVCFVGAAQDSRWLFPGILLALWPVSWRVSKSFYAS